MGVLMADQTPGVYTITNIVETVLSTGNTSNRVRFLTDTSKPLNNSAQNETGVPKRFRGRRESVNGRNSRGLNQV